MKKFEKKIFSQKKVEKCLKRSILGYFWPSGPKFFDFLTKIGQKFFFSHFFKKVALQMFRKIKKVSRIHFIDLLDHN